MEIESYDPYHIGIKLKSHVDLKTFEKKIKENLKKNNFVVTDENITNSPLPKSEIIGKKDNVNILLNTVSWAINSVGDNPNDVIKLFEEVCDIVKTSGYEKEATIDFYEIITNIMIKTDKKPIELLNKNLNFDLKFLADNNKLNVIGVRVSDKLSIEGTDFTQIIIEPQPTSPNNRMVVRVIFRSSNREKINVFHNTLENKISNFFKQF